MADQFEETEKYLKETEQNIEQSFGFLFRIFYKLIYGVSGMLVPLFEGIGNLFSGKKEDENGTDIF